MTLHPRFVAVLALLALMALAMSGPSYAPIVTAQEANPPQPSGLLLTWQRDPTTTMTIDWHGPEDSSPVLRYQPAHEAGWQEAQAHAHAFPHSDRTIFRVELTGLTPGADYHFKAGAFTRTFSFRTMPSDIISRPLRFAAGGDIRHRQELMEKTNRAAMAYDLDFVVWGGDFAYANGNARRVDRWYEWFDANLNTLITDDGRVVPVVAAIGNHEVQGGYITAHDEYEPTNEWRARIAPFFYSLFAFPGQPGYGTLDFGEYLSLVILDTNHTNPIEGAQTEWLRAQLAERTNRRVPHILPVYHVPAWPSHRPFTGRVSTSVREHWVPLFDEYNIRVALEHHDHTYKRTHPLRGGKVDASGTVYFGDGAWGVGTRAGNSKDEWYINQFASERHAIIVTLQGTHQHFLVVNEDGDVLDEYPETPVANAGESKPQSRGLSPDRGVIVNMRPAFTDYSKLEPWIDGIGYLRVWGGSRGMATYPTREAVPEILHSRPNHYNVVPQEEIDALLELQRKHDIEFIYMVNINDTLESQMAFIRRLQDEGMRLAMLEMGNEMYLRKFAEGLTDMLGVTRQITARDHVQLLAEWLPEVRKFGIPVYVVAASHGTSDRPEDQRRREWNEVLKAGIERRPGLVDGVSYHRYGGRHGHRGVTHEEEISNDSFDFLNTFGDLPIAITESGYFFEEMTEENLDKAAEFWSAFRDALKPTDLYGVHVLFNPRNRRDGMPLGLYDEEGITPVGKRFERWLKEYRRQE
jgi:acid phosphatase type 7